MLYTVSQKKHGVELFMITSSTGRNGRTIATFLNFYASHVVQQGF